METHEEKIMNRVKRMDRFDDNHDGVEEARKTLAKRAEFYENNKVENIAENFGKRIFQKIKRAPGGLRKDINNIANGFKDIFSSKKEINNNEINLQQTIADLNLNSDEDLEKYRKTMLDYIREGDEKWGDKPHWQKERARAWNELEAIEKEYTLQAEKKSSKEVAEWENHLKKNNVEQIYDRLARSGHDKNKNISEACINILYNRDELQFDNPNLWTALENLSDNKVLFKDYENSNSREIMKKIKEAVELIWHKENTRKWGIVKLNGEIAEIENKSYKLAA